MKFKDETEATGIPQGMTFTGDIARVNDIHDNGTVNVVNNFYPPNYPFTRKAAEAQGGRLADAVQGFEQLVVRPERAEAVISKLHELVERQTKPREVAMPVRAAMDAGVIRRPTWGEFCKEFGERRLSSKSLLSSYTGEYRYIGEDFKQMVALFKEIGN